MVKRRCAALLAALLLWPAIQSFAQSWPSRPIQIVVSSGAGGTADIMARLIGEKLSPVLGQPVVIENRLGAGGHVGAASVARTNPDGYTLLVSGSPTHSVGPHLLKTVPKIADGMLELPSEPSLASLVDWDAVAKAH
jgi:tripartite-type tricarboxylate transporter receptor subunit TctC